MINGAAQRPLASVTSRFSASTDGSSRRTSTTTPAAPVPLQVSSTCVVSCPKIPKDGMGRAQMPQSDIQRHEWVRRLPKAELHMHLEGSLEPELMFSLAARNQVSLPFRSVAEVRAAYEFQRLDDFLAIYYR